MGVVMVRKTTAAGYSTSFPATENPISESGIWINGLATGIDWNNAQTTPNKVFGAEIVGGYNDCLAVLGTTLAANQYVQGVVHRAVGYSPAGSHEIELLVRFAISAHSARGYELLWAHSGELNIVRWNGPLNDYTMLGPNSGYGVDIGPAVDGDIVRLEINGSVITAYVNGLSKLEVTNTTWTDGQPGIGFWPQSGATLGSYGWKSLVAGAL